jgi:hypothetical protein
MTILFFVVYAGFIAWFAFLIAPAMAKMSGARLACRNPEWLSRQPEVAARLRRRRAPVLFSWLWGVALLGALSFAAFATEPLEAMTVVLILSIVASTLSFFIEIWSYARLNRLVPAPAKREADLKSTRHDDHVPAHWVNYWSAGLLAALALYAFAYSQDLVPLDLAVARMIGIGLIIVLSQVSNRMTRKQPPQPGARKVGIGVMAFCSLVVIGRIAQDFFEAPEFNEIWFWFFFAVAMQAGFALATIRGMRDARRQKSAAP